MKAIHADPRETRKIFTEKYIIPEFQRPYSWNTEQCDKLWEDLIDFFYDNASTEDRYFLGNMVLHSSGDAYMVIDGQQRLTTLLLLIKAFHLHAGIVKALEECIKLKDPLTSELTDTLRIDSLVLENDRKYLYDIIFNNGLTTPENSPLKINFKHLNDKISTWWLSEKQDAGKLNKLILTLLDQVVLLPIHCSSEDDSLIIFETINNRGMSLTDADIFKAKLHRIAGSDKDAFMRQWRAIENHEWYFRIYMHICRAKDGDSGKEIALRTYFTSKNKFQDWQSTMNSLQAIYDIESNWGPTDDITILWFILYTYPNYYWNYPLYVFLHKYGKWEDDEFSLPENYIDEFTNLLKITVKYFFIKGVVYNSVNAVKDTAFKVCASIEKKENYLAEYENDMKKDYEEFERRIINGQHGRYLRGLVLLAAYLNPKQDQANFSQFVMGTYHIEHILPVKWNNYDGWTQSTWEQKLNTIGNLIPLEWKLNINAKNEFFDRKKELYSKSLVQDAIDLKKINDWHPDDRAVNHNEKLKRLFNFFTN